MKLPYEPNKINIIIIKCSFIAQFQSVGLLNTRNIIKNFVRGCVISLVVLVSLGIILQYCHFLSIMNIMNSFWRFIENQISWNNQVMIHVPSNKGSNNVY